MKKLLVLLAFGFVIVQPVFAQSNINSITGQVAQQGGYQTAGVTDITLSQTVGRIVKIALGLVGTIFLALTIYAGFLWMTAGGNEENITKAKGILTASIIGLAITLAAYSITYFVVGYITSANSPTGVVGGPT